MKKIISRQDMADTLLDLIEPLKKYYSKNKA